MPKGSVANKRAAHAAAHTLLAKRQVNTPTIALVMGKLIKATPRTQAVDSPQTQRAAPIAQAIKGGLVQ